MKAIVQHDYGSPDVLKCEEIEKPVPADNEVLVKVRAASLNALDWRFLRGKPYLARIMFGLRRPKFTRPGRDLAGVVEAVGKDITQFKPRDEVFGVALGSFSEYVCAKEDKVALKPANTSFDEAATLPVAGITALQGLHDKGQIQQGQKVLIDGASGGLGTFAVQIAKSFGAEVTAVCSTKNLDMARATGADHLIDYKREDFTKSAQRYDLILAANGHHSIFKYRRALRPHGIYVMGGGGLAQIFQAFLQGPLLSLLGSRKVRIFVASIKREDLTILGEFLASGKIKPVIDKCYGLSEVPEAVRYLEDVHARGKVVISL